MPYWTIHNNEDTENREALYSLTIQHGIQYIHLKITEFTFLTNSVVHYKFSGLWLNSVFTT